MNYEDLFIAANLPKPLNKRELHTYFEKYNKDGDMAAREVIINSNIRLVISIVTKKYSSTPYDKKELVAIGLIGLLKSVDTFDIAKGLQFTTYAGRCINNEILMFMRKGKKYLNNVSIELSLGKNKDGNDLKLEDILVSSGTDFLADYMKEETILAIRELVNNLSERDKEIVMYRFGFIGRPHTHQEIADRINVSSTSVMRFEARILQKIRLELQAQGLLEFRQKYVELPKNNKKKGSLCSKKELIIKDDVEKKVTVELGLKI